MSHARACLRDCKRWNGRLDRLAGHLAPEHQPSSGRAPFCAEDSGWVQPSSSRGSSSSRDSASGPLAPRGGLSGGRPSADGRDVPSPLSFRGVSAIAHLLELDCDVPDLSFPHRAPARCSAGPPCTSRKIAKALV
jgi:hypothetical protein